MQLDPFDEVLRLAEAGKATAQTSLGWFYAHGIGTAPDQAEAVKWYRRAAEQGEPAAEFNLGIAFELGRGVAVDYNEARSWYERAARQGDPRDRQRSAAGSQTRACSRR